MRLKSHVKGSHFNVSAAFWVVFSSPKERTESERSHFTRKFAQVGSPDVLAAHSYMGVVA